MIARKSEINVRERVCVLIFIQKCEQNAILCWYSSHNFAVSAKINKKCHQIEM